MLEEKSISRLGDHPDLQQTLTTIFLKKSWKLRGSQVLGLEWIAIMDSWGSGQGGSKGWWSEEHALLQCSCGGLGDKQQFCP